MRLSSLQKQLLILLVTVALQKTAESISDRLLRNDSVVPRAPEKDRTKESVIMSSSAAKHDAMRDSENLIDGPLPEMPLLPITSESTVHACRAMKVSPSKDVFVCSYPKSGTTWTQNIVVRLLWEFSNPGCPLPEDWHLSHSAPFYEVDQYWRSQNEGGTNERIPAQTPIISQYATEKDGSDGSQEQETIEYRVFNTHLRPNQLPDNAKCVYVARDPFDVMVSFYHHLSNQSVDDGGYEGSFKDFCTAFLDGTILYGKWQDHLEAWLGDGGKPTGDFLLLHYEDMKRDLGKETKRIAKFLLDGTDTDNRNDDHATTSVQVGEMTDADKCYVDELVSRVVPHCTFAAMKRERQRYTPLTVSWKINPETGKPYDEFVRKGNVGEGGRVLEGDFSSELKDRWINRDVSIAKARWMRANVDEKIVDRYLQNHKNR